MAAFRNSLVMSFVFKACVATALQLRGASPQSPNSTALAWANEEASAVQDLQRPPARGVQFHAEAEPDAIVGQPVKHRAADLQVSIPPPTSMLFCAWMRKSGVVERVQGRSNALREIVLVHDGLRGHVQVNCCR